MRPIPAIAVAAALLFASAAQAAEFSTLEERMSEQEFRAAGLDRLSADELASLNAWLARRNVTTVRAPSGGSEGFRSSELLGDSDSSSFSSIATSNQQQIAKGSIVTLENGQAWEITSGSLTINGSLAGKSISVDPAALGSWRLKVEGYNVGLRAIRVR